MNIHLVQVLQTISVKYWISKLLWHGSETMTIPSRNFKYAMISRD